MVIAYRLECVKHLILIGAKARYFLDFEFCTEVSAYVFASLL